MGSKYSRKKSDMKEVQCYNYQRFDHYARDCKRKKESRARDDDEVQYAHARENDSDDMLLMANTQTNNEQINMWYLNLGCNNHITENKKWFTKLGESVKKVIKFADGRHVTSEGIGNIIVMRMNGRRAIITDILYLTSMTSNLIRICQLLPKGYNMNLEENLMKVYNGEGRMILKAPLANNKTFKIKINMVDPQCLISNNVEDKNWLWHHMYEHLNFRGLDTLNQKKMVYDLPQVKEPSQLCEEFCKAKQARKEFKHDLSIKSRENWSLFTLTCVDLLK
ncbi:uncharacterized protein LOC127123913 [Lathyrus oleraceus]|uniref:uncharacterized protein LOC127123913 n=1 Tax=Pisum sativum TaxID=3888 RepID=UPI0021D1A43E|nr:uncharacterized protein LOC127123913 [Pisum sativum]